MTHVLKLKGNTAITSDDSQISYATEVINILGFLLDLQLDLLKRTFLETFVT